MELNININININPKKMALNNNKKKPSVPKQSSSRPRPEYLCLICFGNIIEETLHTCGHVFCAACIRSGVVVKGRCPYPKCHRMFQNEDAIRIYF